MTTKDQTTVDVKVTSSTEESFTVKIPAELYEAPLYVIDMPHQFKLEIYKDKKTSRWWGSGSYGPPTVNEYEEYRLVVINPSGKSRDTRYSQKLYEVRSLIQEFAQQLLKANYRRGLEN